MDMENIQKNNKNDKLGKMWTAENIKANLSKLAKLSLKQTPLQSPLENISLNQTETNFGDTTSIFSPRSKRSTITIHPCNTCDKYKLLYKKQLKEKENIEAKYREAKAKYQEAIEQNISMSKKLSHLQKIAENASKSVEPYQNNVILMEQHLQQIKQSINNTNQAKNYPTETQTRIENELNEKKRTIDFEIHFLLKNHEREQENNESKLSRLNFVINYLENKNKELEIQNAELSHENKILNGIIHESTYVVQQRELFHMASEQLYQHKINYISQKNERQRLERFVEKLKNKIYMLTSLIGYGVVSNIETNELHELNQLKKNLQQLNKVQQKLTFDACGTKSLKNYKSCYSELKQFASNQEQYNKCLYHSNFLIMFDDQQIQNGLEENVATIIKPDFFLLVRAILDSRYSQFLVQGAKINRFPQFVYSFLDSFRVKRNSNRIQINSKRNSDEKDLMKNNFLLRIFDRKVGFLPEIATFRQFLIKNTPQDEAFYYLMCRNIIYKGPELDTYLGSSDPYNFASYEQVVARTQQLLQNLDRNCKTIIFNHLNDRKIMKNKKLLIKANYVIRLLLEVYRKIKREKESKLRGLFDQTCRMTKCEHLKYSYFKQILRKNFPNLSASSISEYYRQSMSIFESNNGVTFYECFSASCLQYIFLEDNLDLDRQIRKRKRVQQECQRQRCNYLMELIPDSVSQLGNQSIYHEYVKFIKLKGLNIQSRVKISQFLLKIIELRLHSMGAKQKQQQRLAESLDQFNNQLIDKINQNFKKRQKYQESLDIASSIIGKEFRKKIYEFYSEFVKDIKQQISSSTNNPLT